MVVSLIVMNPRAQSVKKKHQQKKSKSHGELFQIADC